MSNVINPTCNCLHPRRLFNQYLGDYVVVPCGYCEACRVYKNSHYAFLCNLERQSHKYCLFVTLTYANRFIPRASFASSTGDIGDYSCNILVDSSTGEILSDYPVSHYDAEEFVKKTYLFGYVPYLRKSDLQKFLKRLRYYVSLKTSSPLRYFAVGEYGPEHFRPHYHLLLYFSDERILQVCNESLSKIWPFGRVDCQHSSGDASLYVAGYVNSYSYVPQFLKAPAVSPFCVHSQKLGQGLLQNERTKVYQTPFEQFIRRSVVLDGNFTEYSLWRSCYAYYYPKCKGFTNKSARELLASYSIYESARYVFPFAESCFELAKETASMIHYFHGNIKQFEGCYSRDTEQSLKLDLYFYDKDADQPVDSDLFSRYVNRIYSELLVSKHFLYFVCDNTTMKERERKLNLIREFYSRLDYLHLVDFFKQQQQFFESDFAGDVELEGEGNFMPFFYDNFDPRMFDLENQRFYRAFASKVHSDYQKRIKHKRQNDLNKIFFEENHMSNS